MIFNVKVYNFSIILIPFIFTDRHPVYKLFIEEINKVLYLFSSKKASSILLTDFTGIFKCEFIHLRSFGVNLFLKFVNLLSKKYLKILNYGNQ